MARWLTWVLGILVAIVVLVVVAVVAIPRLVDLPRVQALIASNASQTLGRPVRFASMSVSVLPLPSVELHRLEVGEDPHFGTEPFLRLDTGRIRLRLRPLLRGRVELGDLVLTKPLITVIQAPDGRLNVASLGTPTETGESRPAARPGRAGGGGAPGGAAAFTSRIEIDGGVITYVAEARGGTASRYRVEGLDLTLDGQGTKIAVKGQARVTPGDLSLKLSDGVVSIGGARSLMEAPIRGTLALETKDVKALAAAAAGPSPALGGPLKGTLAVAGTAGAPTASGKIDLSPLTVTETSASCPPPKQRTLTLSTLTLDTTYQADRLAGRPLHAVLASGTITTQLLVSLDRGMEVSMSDLAIKALPLEKVLVDFLCQGYAVSGPLDLTGGLRFSAHDMWNTLSGPGTLHIGAGKVVGPQALALIGGVVRVGGALSSLLSADLPASLFNSPLEFDSITGTYQLTNGVATTRDLLYTSRAMKVAVAGQYALASGKMDLDMVVTTGRGEVKAKVTGTAASPSIRVAPSSLLRQLPQGGGGDIQKGLGDLLKRFK